MKQFNYELVDLSNMPDILKLIYSQAGTDYNSILFHLYTIKFTKNEINSAQKMILEVFPSAQICGTSSNGDICDGHLADYGMVIAVSVFDSTDVNVKLFECKSGNEQAIGQKIKQAIDSQANIKAAEILITLKSINSRIILSEAEKCSDKIVIFGGGSAAFDISDTTTFVIDDKNIVPSGVLLVMYSGDDLQVDVHHAIGWKPLGKDLTVTKIDGKHLYEIDETPAGLVYSKYLGIHADEDFFSNILEFPIMSHQHGYEVLRLPFECHKEDNSILLAADIDKGTPINLSYGDPDVIKDDVINLVNKVKDFSPEAIFLYSCGVRRLYWKYLINKETAEFSSIAPTAGFYSSGEIMRMDKYIIEHHVTLIAISMREGSPAINSPSINGDKAIPMTAEQKMHSQISMVRRLAHFINVTASELQEANDKLQEIADTDELTGLYNRRMLDRIVYDCIDRANKYNLDVILGIVDIDDFKHINDTYGHSAGDLVLKTLSKAMYKEVEKLPSGIFGRWGGEEFLFVAPQLKLNDVVSNINAARERISKIKIDGVESRTLSIGITSFVPGDTVETIFKRADDALYEAKTSGKNKICIK